MDPTGTAAPAVAAIQKRVLAATLANGPSPRGKENDESLVNHAGGEPAKSTSSSNSHINASKAVAPSHASSTDEAIDIESVDSLSQQAVHSDTEYTEDGRPIRKRKAKVPFDEDTDMDTDELLETEVKTKGAKSSTAKPKYSKAATKAIKQEDGSLGKPPRKTNKKPTRSSFSDDEDDGDLTETIVQKLKRVPKGKVPFVKPEDPLEFDPSYVYSLARQYPDNYWNTHAESRSGMLSKISDDHPLQLVDCNIQDQAPITGMALSPDGTMLATFCNLGSVRVWSLDDYSLLTTLRDAKEEHIDEFYVGTFVPDQTKVLVGGKRKDRNNWSEADDDNNILPCPLKLFDVLTGEVIVTLEGHTEELLCVKRVQFKGENYFLSGSQDGYLNKWHMDSDW
ncbi:hypothetical protein BGZ99_008448, partial [Dissophora globulifera]